MSGLQAMSIAIAVSVCVSTILVAGLTTPLRAILRRACPRIGLRTAILRTLPRA
jgi:hypothetical protein